MRRLLLCRNTVGIRTSHTVVVFGGCLHKGAPAGYCVLAGKRNKQAKDKQMTFTAIVWSKAQFVT